VTSWLSLKEVDFFLVGLLPFAGVERFGFAHRDGSCGSASLTVTAVAVRLRSP